MISMRQKSKCKECVRPTFHWKVIQDSISTPGFFTYIEYRIVMWNDIDLYRECTYIFTTIFRDVETIDAYRDFTTDPVTFPVNEMRLFIEELVC